MKNLIIILVFLSSCTPQKRLNRLVKKNPELVKIDTVRIIDTIVIESFHFDTIIQIDKDYSKIDSIFFNFKHDIDSLKSIELKQEIKNYIINKPLIKDTLFFEKDLVKIKVYQDSNGQIRLIIDKPEQEIIRTHEITHPTILNITDYFSGLYKWGVLLLLIVIVFGAVKLLS
jgi:hypothetical protein